MPNPERVMPDTNEETLTCVRELGFDTTASSDGFMEKVFFLGPDIGGLRKRGAHATEDAIQEFIAYWENQIQVAKDYLANGRTNRTDKWVAKGSSTRGDRGLILGGTRPVLRSTTIVALGLSARPFNCLYEAGIHTLECLVQCRKSDLLKLPKMGKASVNEIENVLATWGLALRPERFEEKKKPGE